ncbi:hypothetical protein ACRRTK_001858 [Alexandromys fortis]
MVVFRFPHSVLLRSKSWAEYAAQRRDSMSEQSQQDQYCTIISQEHVTVLQEAFNSNMFPREQEIQELASRLKLKVMVVEMWFISQQDQLQTQQGTHQCSPLAASSQVKRVRRAPSNQATRKMGNKRDGRLIQPGNKRDERIIQSGNKRDGCIIQPGNKRDGCIIQPGNKRDGRIIQSGNKRDGCIIQPGNKRDRCIIQPGNKRDGRIIQSGNKRDGRIIQAGNDRDGCIIQAGNDRDGCIIQAGNDRDGCIIQAGNDRDGCIIQPGNDSNECIIQPGNARYGYIFQPGNDRDGYIIQPGNERDGHIIQPGNKRDGCIIQPGIDMDGCIIQPVLYMTERAESWHVRETVDEQYQLFQGECWDAEVCVALQPVATGSHAPTAVQRLAIERLQKKEALAISVLEDVAWKLHPAGFEVAFMNRQTKVLRAIVPTWPFPCLPVGALIKTLSLPHLEALKALLDGLDVLVRHMEALPQETECPSTGFDNCGP